MTTQTETIDDTETPAPVPLISAALYYADRGLRVFPLSPGTKIPFKGSNGCLDASSNADIVRGWWESTPEANIGIATGHLVDVVDIDGPPGQASRVKHWCYNADCRAAGSQAQPPTDWTHLCEHDGVFNAFERACIGKVSTPRPGGMHLYIPAQPGASNGARLFDGVDYRGLGGYVVAPPSIITEGPNPGTYRWIGTPTLGAAA